MEVVRTIRACLRKSTTIPSGQIRELSRLFSCERQCSSYRTIASVNSWAGPRVKLGNAVRSSLHPRSGTAAGGNPYLRNSKLRTACVCMQFSDYDCVMRLPAPCNFHCDRNGTWMIIEGRDYVPASFNDGDIFVLYNLTVGIINLPSSKLSSYEDRAPNRSETESEVFIRLEENMCSAILRNWRDGLENVRFSKGSIIL